MSDAELITIGMTCFNAEDLIGSAIDSALNQTWDNFEIVIVDDGSSDGSPHVIQEYASQHEHIRFIQHDVNKGFPVALNTVFGNARGKYIALFDDDDISMADRLSKQYERMTSYERAHNTEMVFCYTNREVYALEDQEIPLYKLEAIGREDVAPSGEMVADYLLWHTGKRGFCWGMFGSCTLMVRTETVKKSGGFDESFKRCAEWDIAVRAAHMGAHFIAVDDVLVHQFKTPSADKANTIPLKYALKLRRKHKAYMNKKGVGLHLASVFLASARFYGSKNHMILARFFRGLHFILVCGR